jgi:WD40 repeat protein
MSLSLRTKLEGDEGPIATLRFSWDSRYLLSASQDSTIRIWSLQKNQEIIKLQSQLSSVNSFMINPDDSVLFSGGSDSAICRWTSNEALWYTNIVAIMVPSIQSASMRMRRWRSQGPRLGREDLVLSQPAYQPDQALEDSKDSITGGASSVSKS